jgi:hypothetical protein
MRLGSEFGQESNRGRWCLGESVRESLLPKGEIMRVKTLFGLAFTVVSLCCGVLELRAGLMENYKCIYAQEPIPYHSCSCFSITMPPDQGHEKDTCEKAVPDADGASYTTGCNQFQDFTCQNNASGTSLDCGDVWVCQIPCNVMGNRLPCTRTEKGTCNKTYGGCSNPTF